MSNTKNVKLQEHNNKLSEQAEDLIVHGIPKTVFELSEILATPIFNAKNFQKFQQDFNRNMLENSSGDIDLSIEETDLKFPCNGLICKMVKIVKPITNKMLEDCSALNIWIALLIPQMEDGNNFGVSIQKEILKKIQDVIKDAHYFGAINSQYQNQRSKLYTKVLKYSQIVDYKRAINELDEKMYELLKDKLKETRNNYLALHDLILKNLEKLKTPRSLNNESLY